MFHVNEMWPALLVVGASQTKLEIWLAAGPPIGGGGELQATDAVARGRA